MVLRMRWENGCDYLLAWVEYCGKEVIDVEKESICCENRFSVDVNLNLVKWLNIMTSNLYEKLAILMGSYL